MRVLFFISFLISITGNAQTKSIEDIDFRSTDTLKGPYAVESGQSYLFIASGFGTGQVSAGAKLDSISNFLIKDIVLVYSKYHKAQGFNQAKLNDSRWSN